MPAHQPHCPYTSLHTKSTRPALPVPYTWPQLTTAPVATTSVSFTDFMCFYLTWFFSSPSPVSSFSPVSSSLSLVSSSHTPTFHPLTCPSPSFISVSSSSFTYIPLKPIFYLPSPVSLPSSHVSLPPYLRLSSPPTSPFTYLSFLFFFLSLSLHLMFHHTSTLSIYTHLSPP